MENEAERVNGELAEHREDGEEGPLTRSCHALPFLGLASAWILLREPRVNLVWFDFSSKCDICQSGVLLHSRGTHYVYWYKYPYTESNDQNKLGGAWDQKRILYFKMQKEGSKVELEGYGFAKNQTSLQVLPSLLMCTC